MTTEMSSPGVHSHVFLGEGHEKNERRAWFVIVLCGTMMVIEIVGGLMFGSIALVADGLHMSTHAGALLLAALAYTFARRHASDPRFSFGTGKVGDIAGFTSAVVLAMIALLIGFESVVRVFKPVPIHFQEAIPIAFLGLAVNIASAWILSAGGHAHGHSHGHSHGSGAAHDHDEVKEIAVGDGRISVEVFEDGVPPRFRLTGRGAPTLDAATARIVTERDDGTQQTFTFADRGGFLESAETIPEPHAFTARVMLSAAGESQTSTLTFEEHDHAADAGAHGSDNNMRAAIVHVAADAVVSVLVIVGLFLARLFGWLWMDPLAGIVGAVVIASWAYGLVRDTGAILLDMNPDRGLAARLRQTVEDEGDAVADLHLWRLGPGHLGAIVSVASARAEAAEFYRQKLGGGAISHLTIEVIQPGSVVQA